MYSRVLCGAGSRYRIRPESGSPTEGRPRAPRSADGQRDCPEWGLHPSRPTLRRRSPKLPPWCPLLSTKQTIHHRAQHPGSLDGPTTSCIDCLSGWRNIERINSPRLSSSSPPGRQLIRYTNDKTGSSARPKKSTPRRVYKYTRAHPSTACLDKESRSQQSSRNYRTRQILFRPDKRAVRFLIRFRTRDDSITLPARHHRPTSRLFRATHVSPFECVRKSIQAHGSCIKRRLAFLSLFLSCQQTVRASVMSAGKNDPRAAARIECLTSMAPLL